MQYSCGMVAPVPLYLRVADDLAALIAAGRLRPLERVPSVRQLARQRGISLTTAVGALRHLEQRGLVEARPQSGYFVARRAPRPAEPRPASLPKRARLVGMQALLARLNEASQDPRVARLGQAIPDEALFPSRQLRRALLRAARNPAPFGRYELRTAGIVPLRQGIARHYARLGAAIDPDEITVTNGCTEALNLALRTVASPGDTIAVESPTYYGLLRIVESLGLKVVELPSRPREGLDVAALRALLAGPGGRAVRACVVISSFSNPSGATLPEAARRELVRACTTHGIALIEDDVYGDLQHEGARPVPCKHWDREGQVILCSSFSKTLAPAARIGFVAGGQFTEQIRVARQLASIATEPLQQEMIAGYLASGHYGRHLARMRRALAAQVEEMGELVAAGFPRGTRVSRPAGGFVLWVELPGEVDALALWERARSERIDFVPGPLFSASGRYANCLRLNCGQPVTPAVRAALGRLGALAAGAA